MSKKANKKNVNNKKNNEKSENTEKNVKNKTNENSKNKSLKENNINNIKNEKANDTDILEETIKERKKLPKELKDKISNLVFFNIAIFMFMMIIYLGINIIFNRFSLSNFEITMKIIQIMVCLISIAIFEFSYKKDSFKIALYGIEFTLFSIAVLYVPYMYTLNNINFLLNIIIVFIIYYILKSIFIVVYYRNKYLKDNYSDVKEILKEDKKGYLDEESKKTLKERKNK